MMLPQDASIGLVLSGGGIRAMVFHLGVLRRLAELKALERVERISSVSGGSLIIGLVLQQNQLTWPNSGIFLDDMYPTLRQRLTERSLQWGALRQLVRPSQWQFVLSRANLLAAALKSEWGITARLADLPTCPEWSINGTNAENGRRFRFKREDLGDYLSGYADSGQFPLSNAMAVSAAFPGGFGPLRLRADAMQWKGRKWDEPKENIRNIPPPARRLHLYDGGVYDNLGLEPYFDAGRGRTKVPGLYILVSDAGMPLAQGFAHGPLSPFRLKRVADIMSDQSRALRVRTFQHYLQQDRSRGAYIYIAEPEASEDHREERKFAMSFPTTLRTLTTDEFDRLSGHGYRMASNQVVG